jgi:hypothetical protein
MSSFGHVRDMMERYAANRELLQAKRKRHFRKTSVYDDDKFRGGPSRLRKLDKAALEKVKFRIRRDKQRELRLWVIASIIALFSVLWAIHSLF